MSIHRKTFKHHALYMFLRGPAIALTRNLGAFVAIKSLGAPDEIAILIALALPLGNLLAIFWSRYLAKRERIKAVSWIDAFGFLILLPVLFIKTPLIFTGLILISIVLRAPVIVALSGVMRENYPPETRAATMGKVHSLSIASIAGSAILFGAILEWNKDAYIYLYPVSAILGAIAVFYLCRIPEDDPVKRKFIREPSLLDIFHVLKRDPDFLRYEASFFVFGFAALSYMALLPLYLASDLNASYREGSIALVINFVLPIVITPFWGRIIDKVNILLMRGLQNLVWALCPIIIYLTDSIGGVIAGQALIGVIQGGSVLVWTLGVNIFARKEEVPTYMGIHQTLTGIRGLIAPYLALSLAYFVSRTEEPDYIRVFLVCGCVMFAAGLFMIWEGLHMDKKGRPTTFKHAEGEDH